MCLVLTLQRGDFCCFPFSSCAFPGTRRISQGPRDLCRNQEILPGFRRFSQGLEGFPRIQEVLPGSRRFSGVQEVSHGQGALLSLSFCSAPPSPHHPKQIPDPFPISQDGEASLSFSPQYFGIHQQHLPWQSRAGSVALLSPYSWALFIFRSLLASPPLATSHPGLRRC